MHAYISRDFGFALTLKLENGAKYDINFPLKKSRFVFDI